VDNSPIAVTALQAKADQAQPRDRCFLYAELISQMTDLAGRQFNSGDSIRASETIKLVQRYAEKIRIGVADDSKKAKECGPVPLSSGHATISKMSRDNSGSVFQWARLRIDELLRLVSAVNQRQDALLARRACLSLPKAGSLENAAASNWPVV
jgi:hypothetical protein